MEKIGYYVDLSGKYYKLCLDEKNVKLEEVEKIPEEAEGELNITASNPSIAEVSLNENGCEIIGKSLGDTNVTFKCNGVTKNINVTVNEKLVFDAVDIGQYVDIGVYYHTPEEGVKFTSGRTVTEKPLTGWRILSKDDGNKTVKLISAGCPLSEELDTLKYGYICTTDKFNYDCCLYRSKKDYGFEDSLLDCYDNELGDYLEGECEFYDSNEGVHGFCFKNEHGCEATVNDSEWCEDDLGEFLRSVGLDKNMEFTMLGQTQFDNASLESLCDEGMWKEYYNDLIDCGEDYWLGGSFCSQGSVSVGWFFENGIMKGQLGQTAPYSKNVRRGIRIVLELKPGVQILDIDGEDGSSEEKAYSLFLSK